MNLVLRDILCNVFSSPMIERMVLMVDFQS